LRKEYGEIHSAVKFIGRQTGAHPRAIRNWYEGVNAPNCNHFVTLTKHTPVIIETFLGLTGHKTVWEFYQRHGNGHDYSMRVKKISSKSKVYDDKNVTINVSVSLEKTKFLNQRQLWFLGCLQAGKRIKAVGIVKTWRVTLRTARRDIAGLIKHGLIHFKGHPKTGFFEAIKNI
jgi:hypothetical protein